MTISCECDHCGASLKVKDKLAGTEGKCPKCHEKIHIPSSPSDDSEDMLLEDDESPSMPAALKKSVEQEEEEAIFGDDFFSLKEPEPRPRYVPPEITDEDEEEEPSPRKKTKPKSSETEIGAEIESGTGANSASIASSLLSKTGKRNRPEDFKDPTDPDKVSYDFSEINYLLLQRILPAVAAATIVFFLAHWMFSDLVGEGANLPELAELTGRVTSNGEGVAGSLRFFPVAGNNADSGFSGSSSFAFAGADGTYQAFYDDDIAGLVIGKHEVEIVVGIDRITREVTIEPGSHVIDFEIAE